VVDQWIIDAVNRPDPHPFLFTVGQTVRVRNGVSDDGQTPHYWNGAMCVVMSCRSTWLNKRHCYELMHIEKQVVDSFEEDEIDRRYARKEQA
jgi:hypothetical protein